MPAREDAGCARQGGSEAGGCSARGTGRPIRHELILDEHRERDAGCDINASIHDADGLLLDIGAGGWREVMVPPDWTHLDKSDSPVDPGFNYSVYEDAFLSAERTVQQQLAAWDPPPNGLTPEDLHTLAASHGRK